MWRVIRGFLAIKSVVFGLLVLALWARSYWVGDTFRKGSRTQYIELCSAAGSVVVRFAHDGGPTRLLGSWEYVNSEAPRQALLESQMEQSTWNTLGFGFNYDRPTNLPQGLIVNLMLPYWLVFLLAIPSALLWVVRRRKAAATSGAVTWCPACWKEWPGKRDKCPRCGGVVAVNEAIE